MGYEEHVLRYSAGGKEEPPVDQSADAQYLRHLIEMRRTGTPLSPAELEFIAMRYPDILDEKPGAPN